MRKQVCHALAWVLASLVAAPALAAQPVAWDSLGLSHLPRVEGLLTKPGLEGDTLWVFRNTDTYRLTPGDFTFGLPIHEGIPGPGETTALSNDGLLVTGDGSGPFRLNISDDGGCSWTEADRPRDAWINCLHQTRHPRFEGAMLACERTDRLWTSPDGRTWQDFHAFPFPNEARALLDLYEGPHAGRLLVALLFADVAVRYSDDGGFSWWNAQGAPFALRAHLTWLPAGVHGPEGVVLATSDGAGLWASTDGGATWARRAAFMPGAFGLEQPNRLFVAPGADGVLWALVADNPGGPRPEGQGVVLRSEDAGVTWAEVPGWPGYGVYRVVVDSQGRLVVGTDAGVWRSQTGVVAVASEAEEPGKPSEAALGAAYPNPAAETVTVPLTLAEPAEVHVAVYDILGREVATLHAGPLAAGPHTLALDTDPLTAGLYVIHAVVAEVIATQRFTVGR